MDYSLAAPPRMTPALFAQVLTIHHSPAPPNACWQAILGHGIDTALALAQFERESSFGTSGAATSHRNWGNLRTSPGYPTIGGFVQYPTWEAGARDYARLLAGPLYAQSDRYSSARTMPYRYAPAADHNAPAAYGDFLVTRITQYIAASGHGSGPNQPAGDVDVITPLYAGTLVTKAKATRIYATPDVTTAPLASTVPAGVKVSMVGKIEGWRHVVVNLGGIPQEAWMRADEVQGETLDPEVLQAAIVAGTVPAADCSAQDAQVASLTDRLKRINTLSAV